MRTITLAVAAVVVSLSVARAEPADDFRQSRAQVILRDAIDTGSPLFNDGQALDCYLVYKGALRSTLPLLADRPDLRDAIQAALWRAEHADSDNGKAWILRHAIDRTLANLN